MMSEMLIRAQTLKSSETGDKTFFLIQLLRVCHQPWVGFQEPGGRADAQQWSRPTGLVSCTNALVFSLIHTFPGTAHSLSLFCYAVKLLEKKSAYSLSPFPSHSVFNSLFFGTQQLTNRAFKLPQTPMLLNSLGFIIFLSLLDFSAASDVAESFFLKVYSKFETSKFCE